VPPATSCIALRHVSRIRASYSASSMIADSTAWFSVQRDTISSTVRITVARLSCGSAIAAAPVCSIHATCSSASRSIRSYLSRKWR
jgi:hypothetical protein